MTKVSVTGLTVLCAALAACSDSATNRTMTAPDAGPAFSEASGAIGFGVTAEGPLDVLFAPEDALAQQSAAQIAAAQAPATGSRASGHVGFNFSVPFRGLLSEGYSFVALSTEPAPTFAAKGEWELMLTSVTGGEQKFHGDVICMSVGGNTARLAGRIEKVWINNVQRPITGATHVIWTVQDNGEGAGTTDFASPMFFNNAANALLHCTVGFTPPLFVNQEGEIQVQL
jgi:hypothetical protein